MSESFALRLRAEDLASLGPLRLHEGLEVCREGEDLWLRGRADEALAAALLRLPALARFTLHGEVIRPREARLPSGVLPEGPWRPLGAALPFVPQRPRPAEAPRAPVPLSLVPAEEEAQPATFLRTSLAQFARWVEGAASVRLQRLVFAADDRGQVLVRGAPLPPLPGERLWTEGGLLVPCGMRWDPALPAALVAEALDLLPGELALLDGEGFERIPERAFVPARRASVRATADAAP